MVFDGVDRVRGRRREERRVKRGGSRKRAEINVKIWKRGKKGKNFARRSEMGGERKGAGGERTTPCPPPHI